MRGKHELRKGKHSRRSNTNGEKVLMLLICIALIFAIIFFSIKVKSGELIVRWNNSNSVSDIDSNTYKQGIIPVAIKNDNIIYDKLVLTLNDSGRYTYDSSEHENLIISDKTFREELINSRDENSKEYDMEGKATFRLDDNIPEGGWEFEFSGYGNVQVFLNDIKVIDLEEAKRAQGGSFTILKNESGELVVHTSQQIEEDYEIKADSFNTIYIGYNASDARKSRFKIQTNIEFRELDFNKEAYVIEDGNEVILSDNNEIYEGDKVYYKYSIYNNSLTNIKDIELIDNKLNLKVNKDGVFIGEEQVDINNIIIYKAGEIVELSTLAQLNIGESLEIKGEIISKFVEEIDSTTDNSELLWKYDNEDGCKGNEYAGRNIKVGNRNIDISINNIIANVLRNSIEIANNENPYTVDSLRLLPGDIVNFKINIKNNSIIVEEEAQNSTAISNLRFSDKLYINDEEIKSTWEFTDDQGNKVEGGNISLEANEEKIIYTSWQVTPDEANRFNNASEYDVKNIVSISHGDINFSVISAEVNMKIQPANFVLKVELVDSRGQAYYPAENEVFSITVKGIADESEFVVEAKAGEVYNLENLKYQEYLITEIVPNKYKFKSIFESGNTITVADVANTGNLNLNGTNTNSEVIIINTRTR